MWTTVFVGFCKNDKNHDVYLLVEAFSLPSDGGMGRKVGEGKFAIYPRPNAPRIKADVEPGEDFYNYTDVLSLLRTVSTDSVQMHCGRIRSVYALREVVVPKPKSPLKTPPKKTIKKPTPIPQPSPPPSSRPAPRPKPPPSPTSSWGGDNISIMLPSSPAFPPLSDGKLVSANIVRLQWLNTLCLKYAHFKKASLSLSCKELMNYLQLIDEQFIKYHVVSIIGEGGSPNGQGQTHVRSPANLQTCFWGGDGAGGCDPPWSIQPPQHWLGDHPTGLCHCVRSVVKNCLKVETILSRGFTCTSI